ncbi:MAG: NERD domain-containing protein [Kiritimatiellae bacterium]|nr:NERD domain-containing protein [Kiritimatiellia bacterium]
MPIPPGQLFLVVTSSLLVLWCAKWLRTSRGKGRIAEWFFPIFFRSKLDRETYKFIHNVMLRLKDESTTQIDHIIVSRHGIFVVELKNYQGWIFGNAYDKEWTQSFGPKKKFRFQNPIHQNHRHVMALAELTEIPVEYFKPVVMFLGGCKLKTDLPPNVGYPMAVYRYILAHKDVIIRDEQVPKIVEAIQSWQKSGKVTEKDHLRSLDQRHLVKSHSAHPTCPHCNRPLVLRTAKRGDNAGQQFWGCSGYPSCRYMAKTITR